MYFPTTTTQAFSAVLAIILTYVAFKLSKVVYRELCSPLRDLPGPPNKSLIYGNFKEIWDSESHAAAHEKWEETYGKTLRYRGFFGVNRVYTIDTKAVSHILINYFDYQKPEAATYNLRKLLGEGVLLAEGEMHKRQRRVLNPAFGPSQIRELTDIFVAKSIEMRDRWTEAITDDGKGRVDALSWLSKMTLDVIGLAGFNYNFDSLSDKPDKNELSQAFATLFKAGTQANSLAVLRGLVPALRFLPSDQDAETKAAYQTMLRIGNQLLQTGNEAVNRTRDILSLLVRANTAKDLSDHLRLSDEDVLAQVPTFLVAGHETTSTATAWALYALTQSPNVQTKLRKELLNISTDNPSMDELNTLPYLDAVIRESLRFHAPIPITMRVAMKDDILPLETPFIDKHGSLRHEIQINKGQVILVPILVINRSKSIWGEDAMVFKPERWESIPEAASAVPGVWGNMLTFIGGPRACIGYRFTIIEMKALLFTLVRAFEFELAVPPQDIVKKSSIVQRPVLITHPENPNQMPLLIRSLHHS
ncbi:cytochrome P450 [Crucibulum laeve]|uniref:Cytochrome P450 n=1 Tax=Crucibulum laeve TaxID=68775 RepID=A0A5C3LQW8_9AGAR|nr:cytochrome P450 [Crucibulum laeve]